MSSVIAAQLYTLREFTKTPSDIAQTLARVRKLGYEAVQLSALGKIDPQELSKILKGEGLSVAATHIGKDAMRDETQRIIDEHRLWGCQYTAIGGFFPKEATLADWRNFCAEYSAIAKKFAGSGVSIGYHNHSHELARVEGHRIMDVLVEQLAPEVWFEIDTYWIAHGGGSPATWIDRVAGRIPCVHLKDMGIKPDRTHFMMEVGEGNLDWPSIFAACKKAGVKWYIIEQDTCYRDPFESLKISLDHVRQMGLK